MKSTREKATLPPDQLARRAEIGRERRTKTRKLLIGAALGVLARKGPDNASIDDYIEAAGVAKGTFYNHFQTGEEIFVAVATELAQEFNLHISALTAKMPDPAQRMACAVRYFIERAAQDHTWGWALVRISLIATPLGSSMTSELARDIEDGMSTGRFKVASPQAATDLVLGSGLLAMRSVLRGSAGKEHASDLAESLLCALGLPRNEASRIARLELQPLDPGACSPLWDPGSRNKSP